MKRLTALILAVCIPFMGVCTVKGEATRQADEVLLPCDDLYIDEGTPDINYNTDTTMRIQNIGLSRYNREAWIRFDLSDLSVPKGMKIKTAVLSVWFNSNQSIDTAGVNSDTAINVWQLTSNEYNAGTITYNTAQRPTRSSIVSSAVMKAKSSFNAGYIDFDISEYIKTCSLDEKAAVSIYPGEYKVVAQLYSSEHSDGKYTPKLSITYENDYDSAIIILPKADTCVNANSAGSVYGSSETLAYNALFSFSLSGLGEDDSCMTDRQGYTEINITEYISDVFVSSKKANFYVTGDDFSVNSKENAENKPYIQINLSNNTIESAYLYLYGTADNIRIYELGASFSESETSFGNMPSIGDEIAQGGIGRELSLTYNGYTQEQLEETYYMALDNGSAYPLAEDVYDTSNIPSEAEIASALNALTHPYVIANNEDFERIKTLKETDPYISEWYSDIEDSGETFLNASATVYNVSSGALSSNIDDALMVLAFLYNTCDDESKKEEYLEKSLYYFNAAATYPDFNPSKALNVGEMSRGIAIAYDWLYQHMTEDQRTEVEEMLIEKALEVNLASPNRNSNNWQFVVNGGTMVAAIAVGAADSETSAAVIKQNAALLPRAMRVYYPDGIFIEASGYFGYASEYLASTLAALNTAFGTDWGLSNIEGFSKSGYYPIYTRGYKNSQVIGYGDGNMTAVSSPLLMWMAEKFNNTDFGIYQREMDNNDIFSAIWYIPEHYTQAPSLNELPLDYCADGISPFASFKSAKNDENGLFAGIKGGFNQMSHGDLDIGNFYIGAFGESFTSELAGVDYHKSTEGLPEYFRLSRYEYYAKSPQGHNTLLINPHGHYPNMSFGQSLTAHCGFTEYVSGEEESYAILNMTSAYSEDAESVYRGIKMDKENNRIILSDKIEPKEASDIWWFMHTDADIAVDGNKAELTIGDNTLYAKIIGDSGAEFRIMDELPLRRTPTVSQFDNYKYIGMKKLAIYIPEISETEIQICFSTQEDNTGDFIPLDMWGKKAMFGHTVLSDTVTSKITPHEDTYSDQTNPDTVRGDSNLFEIKDSSTAYNRECFLKFTDLDVCDKDRVQSVILKVHAIRNSYEPKQEETLSLYETESNWDEGTLTWNNKPTIPEENFICSAQVMQYNENTSVIDEIVEFDITDYYLSLADHSEMSLAIKLTSRKEGYVVIESKEGTIVPTIEITYSQPSATARLKPHEDTYSDQPNPDMVCGNENIISIKYSGTTYNREAFLKFTDLDICDGDKVKSVILKVHAIGNYREPKQEETLSLYATNSSWNEGTLTWDNKPDVSQEDLICTAPVTQYNENTSAIDEIVEFDITDYYLSLADHSEMSFAIKLTSRKEGHIVIESKEGKIAPVIEIEYDVDCLIETYGDYAENFIAVCAKENDVLKDIKIYIPQSYSTVIDLYEGNNEIYVWDKNLMPARFFVK